MRICLIFGPFCLANGENGYDFGRLYTDPRGLSGSDFGFFRIAQELHKLGHTVDLYTFPKPGTELPQEFNPGIGLHHYFERTKYRGDVAVSWNESEPLLEMSPDLLKVVSLQINSLVSSTAAINCVDLWLSPSESHRKMILTDGEMNRVHRVGNFWHPDSYIPDASQWRVVPDGCDPETYDQLLAMGHDKVPGRCVWTSSPDRGLHWLLSIWPDIKRAVPHATLRIFYRLKPWLEHMLRQDPMEADKSIQEQIRRAIYINHTLSTFGPDMGVEIYDSVSRRRIVEEQIAAECFPYTCDTPFIWSEGFSCSLMECCAARACPITTSCDALPEMYSGVIPVCELPFSIPDNLIRFRDLTIKALTDKAWRDDVNQRARVHTEHFTWADAARKMVRVL